MKRVTKDLRCVWPALFEPSRWSKEKDFWEITLLIDKEDDKDQYDQFNEAICEAAEEEWGKVPKALQTTLYDGDEKDTFEGCFTIKLKAFSKPQCVQPYKDKSTGKPALITDPNKIYGGCWVRVVYTATAYTHAESKSRGVTLWIDTVQFRSDDDPLGGGRSTSLEKLDDLLEFEDDPLASVEDLISDLD